MKGPDHTERGFLPGTFRSSPPMGAWSPNSDNDSEATRVEHSSGRRVAISLMMALWYAYRVRSLRENFELRESLVVEVEVEEGVGGWLWSSGRYVGGEAKPV